MLVLAHGIDDSAMIAVGYVAALPGVLGYCGAIAWGLGCDGWRRRGWGIAALVWAGVFPFVFAQLVMRLGGDIGLISTIGICSAASAALLWLATRSMKPVCGCGLGCVLASMVWVSQMDTPLVFVVMGVIWVVPVCVSLAMWGRERRRVLKDGSVCAGCGYDIRGLPGRVCPECGRAGSGPKEGSDG